MGWVWRLRAVWIFHVGRPAEKRSAEERPAEERRSKRRVASVGAAAVLLLFTAGVSGSRPAVALDEDAAAGDRFGAIHWYQNEKPLPKQGLS